MEKLPLMYQIDTIQNKEFLAQIRKDLLAFGQKFASPGGVVCITIAIVIFASAFRMGRRIVEIEEG